MDRENWALRSHMLVGRLAMFKEIGVRLIVRVLAAEKEPTGTRAHLEVVACSGSIPFHVGEKLDVRAIAGGLSPFLLMPLDATSIAGAIPEIDEAQEPAQWVQRSASDRR